MKNAAAKLFKFDDRWAALGSEIKRARERHRMTIKFVAAQSGLPVDTVLSVELGVAPGDDPQAPYDGPSDEILLRIAGAIDCSAIDWMRAAHDIRRGCNS